MEEGSRDERLQAARPVEAHSEAPGTDAADASEAAEVGVGFLRRPRRRTVSPAESVPPEPVRGEPTLADVGGMDAVKRRLTVAFLAPLRNPDLRRAYAKSLRGGLLLYGPPGCGKTFIARAAAGELGAKFHAVAPSDVFDMWLGESERKLHEMFEHARRTAPCVLFFDELDAIGRKRSLVPHHGARTAVNQFLAELDGIAAEDNEGVFVLGATNHPWDVDAALLRPGRFDRQILVLPPDEVARAAILRYHLRGRPADELDVPGLAARTAGFSGADLAHLCESTAEIALEASAAAGAVRPMTAADVQQALRDVRSTTRAWFETARPHARLTPPGDAYDELAAYMRVQRML